MLSILGNEQLVQQMLAGGPPLEVQIELEKDAKTVSGLAWSSSNGPPLQITPGSTVSAAVVYREDRPVDLLVPLYQTWIVGSK